MEKICLKDMTEETKDLIILKEFVNFKIGEMQTKISSPQDDEFDIIMEVGKKEDVKVKCWLIFLFVFFNFYTTLIIMS